MWYSSHRRAINSPPSYPARDVAPRREPLGLTIPAFPHEFHGTRNSRERLGSDTSARQRTSPKPSSAPPWSAAFAVMLVANLMVPPTRATPMVPRVSDRLREEDNVHDGATVIPTDSWAGGNGDVERHPLSPPLIKTHYTFREFLLAVAAASAPFQHLGNAIGETYSVVSGNEVDPPVLDAAQRVGSVVDAATGLIPEVQLTRLPGQFADLAADALEGRPLPPTKLANVLQYGDPRMIGSSAPIQHAPSPVRPALFGRAPVYESVPGHGLDADAPLPDVPPEAGLEIIEVESADADRGLRIEGEHEYLQGYEQSLPPEQIPDGPRPRLVTINGRHYLGGASGYYHVTRGRRAGDWLVNAPRDTRAQVPVAYDAETGKWHADAPLRLCGGGCGPSRESTPDSVGMSKNDVADAIRHLAEPEVQRAILQAYSDLGELHLMRTNREDLRALRDNSIIEHRRVLMPQLMRLDPYSTLFEQQREAALITAIHYNNFAGDSMFELSPEAFCQENAEILFHYLLTRGVPSHHIRMITVQPQGRPPHVMVLYTESDQFIDLLDLTTPHPPVKAHVDGMDRDRFTAAVFLTRDTTILLDPWSRLKASSFRRAADVEELMGMLDVSLADAGHRPANPYRVSLTRPYPAPRERVAPGVEIALGQGRPDSPADALAPPGSAHRKAPVEPSGGDSGTPA